MEEVSVNEFTKRSEDLVRGWQLRKVSRVRGPASGVDLTEVLKYVPYILSTIYYSWKIHRTWMEHRIEKDVKKKLNLWIDESIDRILYLVPKDKIDEDNCRNDMREIVETLTQEIGMKDLLSASDIISNKLFNILQKYYPVAQSVERELVDYITRTELLRLQV
jgi:hypothetical protein